MSKEFAQSIGDLEIEQRDLDAAAELARRYRLPDDVAIRIVEMASSNDQAYAIAELML